MKPEPRRWKPQAPAGAESGTQGGRGTM